ncbi:MAG: TIR domain-containing protein [Clostridia bacterium]|nr:TIR domain-containing protein [Clostridia bacterium]
MEENYNPKVFISYSQDSVELADQVLQFSNHLRQEGIDTSLDQYEESPPEGWPRWMERQIEESDFVIIIGSSGYQQKVLGKTDGGKGVKWESNIIYQKLYMSGSDNNRFIPVVFEDDDLKYIPTPIQGATYYNVSSDKGFDKLYWRLRGVKTSEKPPLGKLRPLPKKERKTLFVTSLIDIKTWDKAVWRGAGFCLGYTDLPTLLLPFCNGKYAKKIFSDWIANVGKNDVNDDIRISLIEGDIPDEEKGYYVVVGTNLDEAIKRAEAQGCVIDETMILNVSRIIRANPTDNFKNYNLFKEIYYKFNEYYLAPAILNEKTGQIEPLMDYAIHKKKLIYRDVKDITDNDQDAVVLYQNKPFRKNK